SSRPGCSARVSDAAIHPPPDDPTRRSIVPPVDAPEGGRRRLGRLRSWKVAGAAAAAAALAVVLTVGLVARERAAPTPIQPDLGSPGKALAPISRHDPVSGLAVGLADFRGRAARREPLGLLVPAPTHGGARHRPL